MRLIALAVGFALQLVAAGGFLPSALAAEPAGGGVFCLQGYRIDHTTIKDDSTILFHMRDGSVYKNSLPSPCVGL